MPACLQAGRTGPVPGRATPCLTYHPGGWSGGVIGQDCRRTGQRRLMTFHSLFHSFHSLFIHFSASCPSIPLVHSVLVPPLFPILSLFFILGHLLRLFVVQWCLTFLLPVPNIDLQVALLSLYLSDHSPSPHSP